MITNTGKNILAKYLVGQTASYASHIAVGCGPKPVGLDSASVDYSDKQSLDFEMFRVPIISRGFVDESGVSKIVLTAELPTQERYEITEVGLFSGASNPAAGSTDSKTIYSFSDSESWKYSSQGASIPSIYEPLDDRVVSITNATSSPASPRSRAWRATSSSCRTCSRSSRRVSPKARSWVSSSRPASAPSSPRSSRSWASTCRPASSASPTRRQRRCNR